uniref:Uncharacterized protein n=1 Tax=Arundo donax TaxID=35708 RepID=A0A0A9SVR1_ARUDO
MIHANCYRKQNFKRLIMQYTGNMLCR